MYELLHKYIFIQFWGIYKYYIFVMERYIMQDNCYRVYLLENDWSDCTHLKMYSVEQKLLYVFISSCE